MANRALQGKVDRDQARRDKLNGRHNRFHGWTRSATAEPGTGEEKVEYVGRAATMPTSLDVKHAERVAIEQCNLTVRRFSTGAHKLSDTVPISDEHRRSRLMAKAKGGAVKLWSGTDHRKGNLPRIVRPTIKWADHPTVWTLYKKS